jgi:hypothetical protein
MSTREDKAVETPAHERGNERRAPSGTIAGRTPTPVPPSDASSPGAEADRAQAEDRKETTFAPLDQVKANDD